MTSDSIDESYKWELTVWTDQSCFQFRFKSKDGAVPSKADVDRVLKAASDIRTGLVQQGWKAAERVAPIK